MIRKQSLAPNPMSEEKLTAKVKWDGRYAQFKPNRHVQASPLLAQMLPRLPRQGTALDIAAGAGRHSLALARQGLTVHALDISYQGLRLLKEQMAPPMQIEPVVLDLQQGWLPDMQYQVIINFRFLERAIWPVIRSRLAPGGWFIMETFTIDQLEFTHKNHIRREFLLEKGELYRAFSFLEILHYDEGLHDNKATAQLVGRLKASCL